MNIVERKPLFLCFFPVIQQAKGNLMYKRGDQAQLCTGGTVEPYIKLEILENSGTRRLVYWLPSTGVAVRSRLLPIHNHLDRKFFVVLIAVYGDNPSGRTVPLGLNTWIKQCSAIPAIWWSLWASTSIEYYRTSVMHSQFMRFLVFTFKVGAIKNFL